MPDNSFKIKKYKSVKLIEPEVLLCTDEENNKSLLLIDKEISDSIHKKLGVTLRSSKDLYNSCKKAWLTLIECNLDFGELGEKYSIEYQDNIISLLDQNCNKIEQFRSEVETLNEICNKASKIKYNNSVLEIKTNVLYNKKLLGDSVFVDITFDFDTNKIKIYTGYEYQIHVYGNVYNSIVATLDDYKFNGDFAEVLSDGIISNTYSSMDSEYDLLSAMPSKSFLFTPCTADYLVNKLKKFKIKTKTDKNGMLLDIDNMDFYLAEKMINSINSVGIEYKTLCKCKDIPIPKENEFNVCEFLAFLTRLYDSNKYNISIEDIHNIILNIDLELEQNGLDIQ